MKIFIRLLSAVLFLLHFNANAQDPSYSQFFNHLVSVNPAYAGMNGDLRIAAIGQHLWYNAPDKFLSTGASMDMNLNGSPWNMGVEMQTFDMEGHGNLTTQIFNFVGAYRIALNYVKTKGREKYSYFQMGMKWGYFNQSVNINNFTFRDQLDPILGVITATSSYSNSLSSVYQPIHGIDASIGGALRLDLGRKRGKITQNTIGYSWCHVASTDQSMIDMYAKLPIKKTLTINSNIPIAAFSKRSNFLNKDIIAPGLFYTTQGPFNLMQIGFNYLQKSIGSSGFMGSSYTYFYGGVWDKTTFHKSTGNINSLVLTAGAQFPTSVSQNGSRTGVDYLKVGFSYDITLGNMLAKTPGTYELSIIYSRILSKVNVNYYNQRSVSNTISLWLLKNKHNELARWFAKNKLKKSRVKCPPMFQ